jgi:hypothetical protein
LCCRSGLKLRIQLCLFMLGLCCGGHDDAGSIVTK